MEEECPTSDGTDSHRATSLRCIVERIYIFVTALYFVFFLGGRKRERQRERVRVRFNENENENENNIFEINRSNLSGVRT
jgi:hypothetical protein